MNILILLNCVIMAIDRYPMSTTQSNIESYANYIFYGFFVTEMVLKMIGLGPR